MPQNEYDAKSTLVQVMVWCRQANVDPDICRHMALLGHNELNMNNIDFCVLLIIYCNIISTGFYDVSLDLMCHWPLLLTWFNLNLYMDRKSHTR